MIIIKMGGFMKNRVTEILGCKFPLILGPMRQITLGIMAAAVSKTGGFGQIAASGLSGALLKKELNTARKITSNPIGVNIPVYRSNALEALEVCIEMGVKTITTSAGNPAKLIERIKGAGLKVLHKVSNVKMAVIAQEAGVDGVIATGFEAGGHIGKDDVTTLCLVPELVKILQIPVIAAGGIADEKGMIAALALGAEGVEVGTRFIATHECPVPDFFKDLIVSSASNSTLLLGKKGMPMRVLKNAAAEIILSRENGEGSNRKTIKNMAYIQDADNLDSAIMPGGQVAGLIYDIKNASEIFPDMVRNAQLLINKIASQFKEDE